MISNIRVNFGDDKIPFEYRAKIRNCEVRLSRINTQNFGFDPCLATNVNIPVHDIISVPSSSKRKWVPNAINENVPFEYRAKIRNCEIRLNRINTQNFGLDCTSKTNKKV